MTVTISHMGNPKKKKNSVSGFQQLGKVLEKEKKKKRYLKEEVAIAKCSSALSNYLQQFDLDSSEEHSGINLLLTASPFKSGSKGHILVGKSSIFPHL